MKRVKIYICAVVFIVLTALKVLLPGQAALLREQVLQVLEKDDDYSGMMSALSRRLMAENPVSSLMEVFLPDQDTSDEEGAEELPEQSVAEGRLGGGPDMPGDAAGEQEAEHSPISEKV